ncbi:hypothetical protein SteCoe_31896 [Stentor coeruleus]|uniref:Transcription and mRNA export factor ENY2 n=1 Tax=Stentor coeruleus TaxID=5963 RepID=A0A1R2B0C6_9CILI|nr:hypothetical protein SteCoe_31896 [Stentor coeruleus]
MIQQDMNLAQRKADIEKRLTESGEKQRLKEALREELRSEGWHDAVTKYCKEIIQNRALHETSNDKLVEEIRPFARNRIPDILKEQLLQKIKNFIEESKEG